MPGSVSFRGPYLIWRNVRLYPAPAFLVGCPVKDGWSDIQRLRPSQGAIHCDLGPAVHLPELERPVRGLKPLAGHWLTVEGMTRVLGGGVPAPDQIVSAATLWRRETRVGLELNHTQRTAEPGHLYAAAHVRPHADLRLMMRVEGWPDGGAVPASVCLGGEHRATWLERCADKAEAALDPLASVGGQTVMALTPVMAGSDLARPGATLPGLGTIRTACLDKAQGIGGWNSARNEPLAMRPAIPAGASWFLEAACPPTGERQHLGDGTAWGYGEVLIGV